MLWLLWAALFASLAVYALVPSFVPPRAATWHAGQTAVAGFVTAIFALAAAVGTFALRESYVRRPHRSGVLDPTSESGRSRVRTGFVLAWALCDGVGVLGLGLALASGDRTLAVPYLLGAAALFVLHRPGAWIHD